MTVVPTAFFPRASCAHGLQPKNAAGIVPAGGNPSALYELIPKSPL